MIYAIARLNILASARLRPLGDCDYAPEGRSYGSERNAIDFNRKDRATRGASACAARAIPQIFNLQLSDKSGFTLRYNPASGITAAQRPALLGWVSKIMRLSSATDCFYRGFGLLKMCSLLHINVVFFFICNELF